MSITRKTISQILRLLTFVFVLAVLLAYVDSEWLEPRRTPPCNPDSLPQGRICLSTALEQWGDRIVWIDARGQDAYERGSVRAPRVYPIRNDGQVQELISKALPALHEAGIQNQCIIVFCDRSCNASTAIANQLREFEFQAPVYVLEGGWDEISKFPTLAP